MSMKQHELSGQDWVLIDKVTGECVLDPSGKGLLTFDSEEMAVKFRDKHDALAHFEPSQVANLLKHQRRLV